MASADRALARELAELHRRLRGVERGRQISSSSVDVDGAPMKVTDGIAAGVHAQSTADAVAAAQADLEVALAENEQAITDAQGELSDAQQRINDAFGEIDLKVDEAYVTAAKQQAIDAAAIDAQAKAEQAEQAAKLYADATGSSLNLLTGGAEERFTVYYQGVYVYDIFKDYVGRTVTVSFDVMADAPDTGRMYAFQGSGISIGDPDNISFPVTTAWERHSLTTTIVQHTEVPNPIQPRTDGEIGFVAGTPDDGYLWRLRNIKIEFGSQGSAWSPSLQEYANTAESNAVSTAQAALTQAESDLQAAIASGDAAAIADAEAKIAVAKAEAIDAAADDAAAKASAAQSAAVQTSQAALDQAESDLQQAISSGDAAAIADAEAKIATAKAEAIAAAADDATAKAAEAMQKANAALTAAQSAQATADNAIRTYYAETPPWADGTTQPDDVLGDMWYQDSTGQAYRWNGTSWKVIQDASIGEALAAAQNAQTTADGKITAFYQDNEPLEADEGDLWFDTNNDSAIHRRTDGAWVALLDPKALADAAEQAAKTAAAADATAKAEAAEAAAVQAAAADAQTKADAAEAAAEAAAKTYADTVASGASQSAIDAAAADAQAKADAARDAAIAAAELDATAKAEAAEAAAAATAAADATEKADAAQAAAIAAAEAVEDRALSRGTDLVTNGTGYLGNNYNFSSFTFDPSDAPPGSNGSFVVSVSTDNTADEIVPVSAGKAYQYTGWARQQVPSVDGTSFYIALQPLAADNSVISVYHYAYLAGTTTTLAADLNPGDTTLTLTDGSAWVDASANHQRTLIWWNWTDSLGKTWPKETYSRDVDFRDMWTQGGLSGNTITLNAPYAGPFRAAGSELSQGSSGVNYIYLQGRNYAQHEWTRYSDTLQPYQQGLPNEGRLPATMARGIPPGTAGLRIYILANHTSTGGALGGAQAFAGISLSDASAAQVTADQALSDAETKANQALADAKAFATERTDGLAKTLWSTALPGTTTAPVDSVWYRHSGGKIVSVFTQTASPSGNSWSARPITSEAIDNLDVGKLTAAQSVINDQVANTFAAKLANIIQANIGNLTVTGDTHLEALVAQTIAGDTASFMQLTVDQILAGFLQAQWIITESGSIVAGNPTGARVEITSDGVRVFVVGPNGEPYEAVAMVNDEISFGVIGQDGTRLGGIASDGSVSGTSGSFSKDVRVKGLPVVGQLGGGILPGWLDNLPRGVISVNESSRTTNQISAGTEYGYLDLSADLHPGRRYRIVARAKVGFGSSSDTIAYMRIRTVPGRTRPTIAGSALIGPVQDSGAIGGPGYRRVTLEHEVFFTVSVTGWHTFMSTFQGDYGGDITAFSGSIYVEDVGPLTSQTGGDDATGGTALYQSTWEATASRMYDKTGATKPGRDGDVDVWNYGGTPTDYQSSAWIYGGGATEADNTIEFGKTLPQALTGATIHRAEIYLRNKVWYGRDGAGNISLNLLGSSSLPSTKVVDGTFWVDDIAAGEGIWIEVPATWFTNGANQGLTMGDHDGKALNGAGVLQGLASGSFHGIDDTDPPLLRITYSR